MVKEFFEKIKNRNNDLYVTMTYIFLDLVQPIDGQIIDASNKYNNFYPVRSPSDRTFRLMNVAYLGINGNKVLGIYSDIMR